MTENHSNFDSEVQKIARTKNGGEVTTTLFWDITVALGKDIAAMDETGRLRHKETLELLSAHKKEDSTFHETQAEECAKKHQEFFPRLPRRRTDPTTADFGIERRELRDYNDPSDAQFTELRQSAHPSSEERSMSQIVAGWSAIKKAAAIVATALLIGLTGIGVTYVGSYFSAHKVEQAEIQNHQTALPTPVVTVTVTPAP